MRVCQCLDSDHTFTPQINCMENYNIMHVNFKQF